MRRPRPAAAVAAALLAAALVAGGAGPARAVLDAPPFALEVWPSQAMAGQPVTIRITPRGGDVAARWDVYLMWAVSDHAAFLAPDGTWSPRPVAFLRDVPDGGAEPVVWQWANPGPPGEIPLAMLVLSPGTDPLVRLDWRFRPALARLTVTPVRPETAPRRLLDLAPLALAALVASAVVLFYRSPSRR